MNFLLSLGGIHRCQVKQDVPLSFAGMKDRDRHDRELDPRRDEKPGARSQKLRKEELEKRGEIEQ